MSGECKAPRLDLKPKICTCVHAIFFSCSAAAIALDVAALLLTWFSSWDPEAPEQRWKPFSDNGTEIEDRRMLSAGIQFIVATIAQFVAVMICLLAPRVKKCREHLVCVRRTIGCFLGVATCARMSGLTLNTPLFWDATMNPGVICAVDACILGAPPFILTPLVLALEPSW
eukprot:GEMP01079126.1.p1 GENE.GEMP01079126.1~~GEMP01079126.1.p1  ORF type:complete len:171 (+),score=38.60 GEMP01079126.1:137-649(+)